MKFLTTILVSLLVSGSFAQQDALTTMFWNNYTVFNPAATGLFYRHHASALYRNQWDGVNGAPNTIFANYDAKVNVLHGGLGMNYIYDHIGFFDGHRANLNYSFIYEFNENSSISAGISAGIMNLKNNATWGSINPNDPSVPGNGSDTKFIMNAGLMYRFRELTIGLSSTQLNEPDFKKIYYTSQRHYYLSAAYDLIIGNNFTVRPQVLLRTNQVVFSADINVLAYYKQQYWAGLSFRTSDAVAFMLGWDIREKFRVGYGYDLIINQLSSVSRGSHEVVLAFLLK